MTQAMMNGRAYEVLGIREQPRIIITNLEIGKGSVINFWSMTTAEAKELAYLLLVAVDDANA